METPYVCNTLEACSDVQYMMIVLFEGAFLLLLDNHTIGRVHEDSQRPL